jgi:hypothetical protein
VKLCKDCRWVHIGSMGIDFARCGNPACNPTDPVSGDLRGRFCSTHRMWRSTWFGRLTGYMDCGSQGRCWEPRTDG